MRSSNLESKKNITDPRSIARPVRHPVLLNNGSCRSTCGALFHEQRLDTVSQWLTLVFTSGTEDPSIEVWLQRGANSSPDELLRTTMILKFAALSASKSDTSYSDRIIEVYSPDLIYATPPPSGPTNFSDALHDLCWNRMTKKGVECVVLSWKLKTIVTCGLSLADKVFPNTERLLGSFVALRAIKANNHPNSKSLLSS
jgi:hypothetical protein